MTLLLIRRGTRYRLRRHWAAVSGLLQEKVNILRNVGSLPHEASSVFALQKRDRSKRPLSALMNSARVLRMTATSQQRWVLRICENQTQWNRILTVCPASLHSFMENARQDFMYRFSNPSGNDSKKSDPDKKQMNEDSQGPENTDYSTFQKILIIIAVLYLMEKMLGGEREFIKWEDFLEKYLLTGEVEYINISPKSNILEAVVNRRLPNGQYVHSMVSLVPPKDVSFEDRLRELEDQMQLPLNQRLEIRYVSNTGRDLASTVLTAVLMLVVFRAFFKDVTKARTKGGNGKDEPSKPPPGLGPLFDPTQGMTRIRSSLSSSSPAEMKQATQGMTFKDVAGMKGAKQEVMEFVEYLKKSEKYIRLGAKLPRGALLLGPPGCGKTLLVKALANEADVPFFFMAGSEFVEVIGGVGASRMRQLFSEARKSAPSIIFIDEIDTIGRNRSGQGGGGDSGFSEVEQTLNQLLVEMDGMDTEKGVIVFAATNRSEVLDQALLRPGRFDRIITIDLPTLEERREIFELHLSHYKLSNTPQVFAKKLANFTPGMSGADIANVCNEAALSAVRCEHSAVMNSDFDEALHRVLVGAEKKTRVLGPQELDRVASHEAGHAVVGWMLENTDPLLRVSIIPRVMTPLGFSQTSPLDKRLYSEDDLLDRMCTLLGGRVAELFYYKDLSSGAEDDLKKVTDMAYAQIRELGMNRRVGHVSFDYSKDDHQYRFIPYSKHLQAIMDEEAQKLIQSVSKRTDLIIKKHWEAMNKIKNALLKQETLTYEDIEKLIGPRPFGRKLTPDNIKWSNVSA